MLGSAYFPALSRKRPRNAVQARKPLPTANAGHSKARPPRSASFCASGDIHGIHGSQPCGVLNAVSLTGADLRRFLWLEASPGPGARYQRCALDQVGAGSVRQPDRHAPRVDGDLRQSALGLGRLIDHRGYERRIVARFHPFERLAPPGVKMLRQSIMASRNFRDVRVWRLALGDPRGTPDPACRHHAHASWTPAPARFERAFECRCIGYRYSRPDSTSVAV